jgi:hypothetical protein
MAPLVDNNQIKSAELLSPLPTYLHLYVWPFAILWPIFARYYYTPELYEKHIASQEWTFVWCGSIITLQSLAWLSTNWSVDLKGLFTSTKAKSVEEAKLIKVIPIANAGSSEICKIDRENVCLNLFFPIICPCVSSVNRVWPSLQQAPHRSVYGIMSNILDLDKRLTTYITGCRQDEPVVSISEAPFPLQSRGELLQSSDLRH